jgi:hypothetical protein
MHCLGENAWPVQSQPTPSQLARPYSHIFPTLSISIAQVSVLRNQAKRPGRMLEVLSRGKCMACAVLSYSARRYSHICPTLPISILLFSVGRNPATWQGQMLEVQSRVNAWQVKGHRYLLVLTPTSFQHSPYALWCLVSLGIQPRGQVKCFRCSPGTNVWPMQNQPIPSQSARPYSHIFPTLSISIAQVSVLQNQAKRPGRMLEVLSRGKCMACAVPS